MHKRSLIILVLIVAVILVAVGFGVWVLMRDDHAATYVPLATAYETSIPATLVEPTDTPVSATDIPPTLLLRLPRFRCHLCALIVFTICGTSLPP